MHVSDAKTLPQTLRPTLHSDVQDVLALTDGLFPLIPSLPAVPGCHDTAAPSALPL